MTAIPLLVLIFVAALTAFPALAQGEIAINITGGSEAGQPCVSSKTCYDPDVVTIQPRTVVAWTNIDTTAHTVTSGNPSDNVTGTEFDSGEIGPGGTYTFVFMSPGTYPYFCSIHPWMTGSVIVGTGPTPSATTPEFGPLAMLVFVASAIAVVTISKGRLGFKL
ncbi:MAG TPA: plastocyanin/azurin family copper-binding protein [Candidatus Nitrosotalea sp.]|nr:plastocyanin/azurin family copper-binding protein [Candidatus Nitrosotalea sp.]